LLLYSRIGATSLSADGRQYGPGPDGGFELPDALAADQLGFASAGKPLWETAQQRRERLIAEELERRKDPATLLEAVEQLVKAAQASAPAPAAGPPAKAAARPAAAKTAAASK